MAQAIWNFLANSFSLSSSFDTVINSEQIPYQTKGYCICKRTRAGAKKCVWIVQLYCKVGVKLLEVWWWATISVPFDLFYRITSLLSCPQKAYFTLTVARNDAFNQKNIHSIRMSQNVLTNRLRPSCYSCILTNNKVKLNVIPSPWPSPRAHVITQQRISSLLRIHTASNRM